MGKKENKKQNQGLQSFRFLLLPGVPGSCKIDLIDSITPYFKKRGNEIDFGESYRISRVGRKRRVFASWSSLLYP